MQWAEPVLRRLTIDGCKFLQIKSDVHLKCNYRLVRMTSREITVRSLSLTHDRIILVRTEIPPIGCSIVESKGWTSYTIKPAAVQKPTRNGWSKPRQGCFNGVLSKILYIISLYTFNIIIISVTYTLIACAHKSCCLVCMYE